MVYFLALALISAATILLELALLRLFAVQQFYHFAFMAISLALLGAGASGSLLSLVRRRFRPAGPCLIFSLTTLGAYLTINYLPFDSFSIAWDSRQLLYLAGYFLAAAVPFLFAGLVVAGELMAAGQAAGGSGSHRVYGANLIGSALGSLASLGVLKAFGGEGAVVVVMILGAFAALLFTLAERRSPAPNQPGILGASLILALAGVAALVWRPAMLDQQLSPYKTLSILAQALDARQALTVRDAASRVDVIESSTIHVMPGLSLGAPVDLPAQAGLLIDGDSLMPITGLAADNEQARLLADSLPGGVAYRLRPQAEVLVIEAGTGTEVLMALAAGAQQVTAVEDNRLISEVVAEAYGPFTGGLYQDPRVELVNQAGRVFARRNQAAEFDLAVVALTDPHRPVTSGAYSLTENSIYTVEAFTDYLATLAQDGLLVVSRWLQTPPSESARTFGMLVAALSDLGLEPAERLIAFRTLRTMTILAGRQPFTAAEIEAVRQFLDERGFDAVYLPGIQPEEANRFNILPEPAYYSLFQEILADPESVYQSYRFDIRPPTDDRPFFFHYFKWRQTPEILASLGLTWQPFGGSGYFVLVALLVLVALAAAVLIIGPLLVRSWRERGGPPRAGERSWRWRVLVYFACLGLAFLFVEIPLAQRFILVLDQPVTALAVVLFAILLFSGLGSLSVPRWRMPVGLGLLIALIVLYPILLGPVSAWALGLPAWGRIGLTVLLIAPLGFLMGLPFAGGLRVVEGHEQAIGQQESSLVPWAWAINGSFSVISSVLAVMVAVSWGYSVVLWLGAAAYAGALLCFGKYWIGQKTS